MQRAKATLREIARRQDRDTMRAGAVSAASGEERELLRRYVDAHAAADPAVIVGMLREEVRCWMPPQPQHFLGRDAVAAFFQEIFVTKPPGEFRLVPTRSNGHPAAANYLRAPGADEFRALSLDVLRFVDGTLDEIVTFDNKFFPLFGLPEVWAG
jgi:RNA polymerase sigma-70 factor (ECF subfamily)